MIKKKTKEVIKILEDNKLTNIYSPEDQIKMQLNKKVETLESQKQELLDSMVSSRHQEYVRKEMDKISELLNQKGKTIIPMSLYFKKDLVKVKFAVGTGKKKWDKRQDKMDQDVKRQLDREVKKINNR